MIAPLKHLHIDSDRTASEVSSLPPILRSAVLSALPLDRIPTDAEKLGIPFGSELYRETVEEIKFDEPLAYATLEAPDGPISRHLQFVECLRPAEARPRALRSIAADAILTRLQLRPRSAPIRKDDRERYFAQAAAARFEPFFDPHRAKIHARLSAAKPDLLPQLAKRLTYSLEADAAQIRERRILRKAANGNPDVLRNLASNTDHIENAELRAEEHVALREAANGNPDVLKELARYTLRIENTELRGQERAALREAANGNPGVLQELAQRTYLTDNADLRAQEHVALREAANGNARVLLELSGYTHFIDNAELRAQEHAALREAANGNPDVLKKLARHTDRIENAELRGQEHVALREAANGNARVLLELSGHTHRIKNAELHAQEHTAIREAADGNLKVLYKLAIGTKNIKNLLQRALERERLRKSANGVQQILLALTPNNALRRAIIMKTTEPCNPQELEDANCTIM